MEPFVVLSEIPTAYCLLLKANTYYEIGRIDDVLSNKL
jgi:hypothetical protein